MCKRYGSRWSTDGMYWVLFVSLSSQWDLCVSRFIAMHNDIAFHLLSTSYYCTCSTISLLALPFPVVAPEAFSTGDIFSSSLCGRFLTSLFHWYDFLGLMPSTNSCNRGGEGQQSDFRIYRPTYSVNLFQTVLRVRRVYVQTV